MKCFGFLLILFFLADLLTVAAVQKNRLIVFADNEVVVYETELFVWKVLYSNEISIQKLIATTSCWKKTSMEPKAIKNVNNTCAKTRPNHLECDDKAPDLFYIDKPGEDNGSAIWSAINTVVKDVNNQNISNLYIFQNIQRVQSLLDIEYPDMSRGLEGVIPSFLLLISNRLNNSEHPEWCSWIGRFKLCNPDFTKAIKCNSGITFETEAREICTNVIDTFTPYIPNGY